MNQRLGSYLLDFQAELWPKPRRPGYQNLQGSPQPSVSPGNTSRRAEGFAGAIADSHPAASALVWLLPVAASRRFADLRQKFLFLGSGQEAKQAQHGEK